MQKYVYGTGLVDLTDDEITQRDAEAVIIHAQELQDHLPAYRFEKENGGIDVGGMTVQTDRGSRPDLIGARIKAKEDAAYTVKWKTPNGFVTLNAATIITLADEVESHVQKCFAAEAAVQPNIDNETITTKSEIESAFDTAYAE